MQAHPTSFYGFLLTSCMEYFAWGAFFAWRDLHGQMPRLAPWQSIYLPVAIVLALIGVEYGFDLDGYFHNSTTHFVGPIAPLLGLAIWGLWTADRNLALIRFLNWRPFVYLGQISYPMYLTHLTWIVLVERHLHPFIERVVPTPAGQALVAFTVALALTVAAGALIWHGVEVPVSRLKKYAPLGPRPARRRARLAPPSPRRQPDAVPALAMEPRLTFTSRRGVVLAGLVALAVAVGWPAGPPALVERVYGARVYPALQAGLTGASNRLPLAIWDVVLVAMGCIVIRWVWRAVREARARRSLRPIGAAVVSIATLAVVAYLWFQLAWGLNYARPPVDARLNLPSGRPRPEEVTALLTRAVEGANRDHAAAHAEGFPGATRRAAGARRRSARGRARRRPAAADDAGPPEADVAGAVLPHGRGGRPHRAGLPGDAAQPRPDRARAAVHAGPRVGAPGRLCARGRCQLRGVASRAARRGGVALQQLAVPARRDRSPGAARDAS